MVMNDGCCSGRNRWYGQHVMLEGSFVQSIPLVLPHHVLQLSIARNNWKQAMLRELVYTFLLRQNFHPLNTLTAVSRTPTIAIGSPDISPRVSPLLLALSADRGC